MHGCSLPGPEVGYSGEVGVLVLGHARHEVRRVHLHLVLHNTQTNKIVTKYSHSRHQPTCGILLDMRCVRREAR